MPGRYSVATIVAISYAVSSVKRTADTLGKEQLDEYSENCNPPESKFPISRLTARLVFIS